MSNRSHVADVTNRAGRRIADPRSGRTTPAPSLRHAGRIARTEAPHHHGRRIARARAEVLSGEALAGVTELFRALADPTRVRILSVLAGGEACVFDLAESLTMTSSAISHQLRMLRALRLVRNRREGREVYYALDDDHVVGVIEAAREHLDHGRTRAPRRRSV